MRATRELREYKNIVPKTENEPDYARRWRKTRQKLAGRYGLIEFIIMMSAESGRDRAFLYTQDPVFIIRNYIGLSSRG